MAKREVKNKKPVIPFFKYLAVVMVIVTLITLGLFKFINILPGEYYLVFVLLLSLITITLVTLVLTKKGVKKRIFGTLLSLIYIVILILGIVYELNTLGFLKKLGFVNYKTENYNVLVLKDKGYEFKDLDSKLMGSIDFKTEGLKNAKKKLDNRLNIKYKTYDDIAKLKEEFIEGKIDSMLVEESIMAILSENDDEFAKSFEVVYDFAVDVETEDVVKEVDITKDSFNVYISGIDTYGSVSSVSRSDVNMVVTVNPKKHKVEITSIPRDYYVNLGGINEKDKLTHAGIYGVDVSVKTIEELLDININYYVKVNFTSLTKIVDALDGVQVYSEYDFVSRDGYSYKKGMNYVDGERALSFVRERKAFDGGDRVRVENQARMIEALIDKAISPKIIVKYNSLIDALESSFVTNMNMNNITDFIKMQIKDNAKWDINDYSLDGVDGYDYTYSYKSAKSYVMLPNEETIINAKNKIKEVLAK